MPPFPKIVTAIRVHRWVLAPWLILALTIAWMTFAVHYYEQRTHRTFYGLAGLHYSLPEPGFEYHPGGQTIHRWTTTYPAVAGAAALLLTFCAGLILEYRHGAWRILLLTLSHAAAAIASSAILAYVDIQVTGVFL